MQRVSAPSPPLLRSGYTWYVLTVSVSHVTHVLHAQDGLIPKKKKARAEINLVEDVVEPPLPSDLD